jgi:hypothetical protein
MYFITRERRDEKPSTGALLTQKVEYPVTFLAVKHNLSIRNGGAITFVLE